jgi:hypothetical protein
VDSKDIIIGQIHGADDISSVPFVMLHYRDGEIRVVVKQEQSGEEAQSLWVTTSRPMSPRARTTAAGSPSTRSTSSRPVPEA